MAEDRVLLGSVSVSFDFLVKNQELIDEQFRIEKVEFNSDSTTQITYDHLVLDLKMIVNENNASNVIKIALKGQEKYRESLPPLSDNKLLHEIKKLGCQLLGEQLLQSFPNKKKIQIK